MSLFSRTRASGRPIRRADHWSRSSRPLHDRRLFPRKLVDVRAEMGFGYNGALQPVIVLESSQNSLYVLCDNRPRLGSEISVYLYLKHPVTGVKSRICYGAMVHRIDRFEGYTACAVVAIIRHCRVISEVVATEPKPKSAEPETKAAELDAKPGEPEEKAAEPSTKPPEISTKLPETSTQASESSTQAPETSTNAPEPSMPSDTRPSWSLAIKNGQDRHTAPEGFVMMGAVHCDACGEKFTIYHHPRSADVTFAGHQAYWFERFLAEQHTKYKLHDDATELPE